MKNLLTLIILLCFGLNTYAQSNDVLAKSYFLKAQENYSEGNNASALKNLDKTVEYLINTNAKIEALYVKIFTAQSNYSEAKEHLKTYFERADESRSDYNEMLTYVTSIDEKKEKERRKKRDFFNNIDPKDYTFKEGLARVYYKGLSGYIDKAGELVISTTEYLTLWDFSEGLAAIKDTRGWGFIDKTGKEVIPLKYEKVRSFSEGLSAAKLNGKYGYIDKTGKIVIPFKYQFGGEFHDGLASVRLNGNGKWGYVNKLGEKVTQFRYEEAYNFSEGLAVVKLNGKYGYIDKIGNVVIPLKYRYAKKFSKGIARVYGSEGEFSINKNGKRID